MENSFIEKNEVIQNRKRVTFCSIKIGGRETITRQYVVQELSYI
jgi:hypothetical protein